MVSSVGPFRSFRAPAFHPPCCWPHALAVPLAVRVGRAETFVNAAVALVIALSYYLLSSMAAYVKDPDLRPDLLIWLPNVVVVGLAWTLLRRASRH